MQVKKLYGDSEKLREMYEERKPKETIAEEKYVEVYGMIDEKC